MSKELDIEYIKERASEMNFVVMWLEKHTEYLKGYPDTLPYIDSRKWNEDGSRNYPLIDCAKAERDDLVSLARHGQVREPPYQNPFEAQRKAIEAYYKGETDMYGKPVKEAK